MAEMSALIEKRLIAVEEKTEYQEYTLEQLGDVLISQQRHIDMLEEKIIRLEQRLKGFAAGAGQDTEEPAPPHY